MKRCCALALLAGMVALLGCDGPARTRAGTEHGAPRARSIDAPETRISGPKGRGPSTGGARNATLRFRGWVLTDLGTLGGGYRCAYGINERGEVVGQAKTARGGYDAFLFRGGVMKRLGTLGGDMSEARAINGSGQIAGSSSVATGAYHAFLYRGGVLRDLGTFGGPSSQAYGINDAGQVVGAADTPTGPRAFLYSGGAMKELGTLAGSDFSEAHGINRSGEIVGWSSTGRMDPSTGSAQRHAFLYRNGVMEDLGTLGGSSSVAYGINDTGHAVGVAGTAGGAEHAFLWRGGRMRDLDTLGGAGSAATAINGAGEVVGQAQTADGATHAFLYTAGVMKDLNRLLPANSGWVLMMANDINEAGQIVGAGNRGGQRRAFLLTPPGAGRSRSTKDSLRYNRSNQEDDSRTSTDHSRIGYIVTSPKR